MNFFYSEISFLFVFLFVLVLVVGFNRLFFLLHCFFFFISQGLCCQYCKFLYLFIFHTCICFLHHNSSPICYLQSEHIQFGLVFHNISGLCWIFDHNLHCSINKLFPIFAVSFSSCLFLHFLFSLHCYLNFILWQIIINKHVQYWVIFKIMKSG